MFKKKIVKRKFFFATNYREAPKEKSRDCQSGKHLKRKRGI